MDPEVPGGNKSPEEIHESETLRGKTSSPDIEESPTKAGSKSSVAELTDLPRNWHPYEILQFLGQGGMGRVYKAFDPRLKRYVALKLLRTDDPELAARLRREAQAQAQVDHPHVCKVYEVGEKDGKLFLSLQYIEGKPLHAVYREMTLEEKIQVTRETAEALHAAHKLGIIHRDIKPSNIMVERKEEGGWNSCLMDFGLAKETEADGMTITGALMGTPQYMAPEQARGQTHLLDRRTDVYSLGVTLYELLSETMPFEGKTTLEVLQQVIEQEPVPLRKRISSIPEDLETIVMKCLEKEPQRRYGSSKELAEDLTRYLEGEPVLASRASVIYRISKKTRKHKVLVTVVAAAVLAVGISGALWLKSRWEAAKRVEAASRFGQKVKEVEALMRYAHLIPMHDITPERARVNRKMQEILTWMKQEGNPSQGPGNYALGQGYLAMEDYEKAKQHLEEAWRHDYQTPDVAYALGLALGNLYQKQLEILKGYSDAAARAEKEKEIEANFRDPATKYLQQSRGADVASPDYVTALLAFYRKEYASALQKARAAFLHSPWLYEAKLLEGNILTEIGKDNELSGQYQKAISQYQEAETAFHAALEVGESDPRAHKDLCSLWKWIMYLKLYGEGGDIQPDNEMMKGACQNALTVDPSMAEAYTEMAEAHRLVAEYRLRHGLDALETLRTSASLAGKAVSLDPQNAEAYHHLGNAKGFMGFLMPENTKLVDEALQFMKQASKLAPNDHRIALDLGNAFDFKGDYEEGIGSNPETYWLSAVRAFRRCSELSPSYSYAYNNLGSTYAKLAAYGAKHGKNPQDYLDQALKTYEKATQVNEKYAYAYSNMAHAFSMYAVLEAGRGKDPEAYIRKAVQSAEKAIAINPDFDESYVIKADALELSAEYRLENGMDPTDALNQAAGMCEAALKINPADVGGYSVAGGIEYLRARFALRKGGPAQEFLEKAKKNYESALSQDERDASSLLGLIRVYILRSEIADARSSAALIRKARDLVEKAKSVAGKDSEVYLVAAELELSAVDRESPDKMEAVFAEVGENLNLAQEINPGDPELFLTQAKFFYRKAKWLNATKKPADNEIQLGLQALDQCLAINPNMPEAKNMRNTLLALSRKP